MLGIFALLAILTAPAAAQTDAATDEAELLRQEAELSTRVTEIETELVGLDDEEDDVVANMELTAGEIESAADALELLALERRQPTIIRGNLAIERFVSGDPAGEALAQEIRALGSADAAQDPLQQQEVLGSIIESADQELAELNRDISEVSASVPALRAEGTSLQNRRTEIGVTRGNITSELNNVKDQLVLVAEDLNWYRNASNRSVLTGRPAEGGANRPALVVKIDNVPNARPQTGINSADIVYVELVEGGATRFAAVFQSENVGTIGPIRSMRTTDVNLLRPLNSPLFANSGGNRRTTQAVDASSLINIGAATGAGGAYFRNSSRSAPHNLFSSDSALRAASNAAGAPPRLFLIRRPGTPNINERVPANGVNISYGSTSVSYTWNGAGWARSQDGAATIDASNGARTAPETVIVRFTPYGVSPADASSPEAITVGSGSAWIFTEGGVTQGTWSKPTADSVTEYIDDAGNTIELLPGRVWVEIPEPGAASLR